MGTNRLSFKKKKTDLLKSDSACPITLELF